MNARSHAVSVDEIRDAFAGGRSADGEDLLMAALDGGMPWDVATRAAALGVADNAAARPARAKPSASSLALA